MNPTPSLSREWLNVFSDVGFTTLLSLGGVL